MKQISMEFSRGFSSTPACESLSSSIIMSAAQAGWQGWGKNKKIVPK